MFLGDLFLMNACVFESFLSPKKIKLRHRIRRVTDLAKSLSFKYDLPQQEPQPLNQPELPIKQGLSYVDFYFRIYECFGAKPKRPS